jgi:preprotein translocase SecE subunit
MRKVIQFLKEVRDEFKNITWPKREALIQLTVVVISISIITSLILGGFDYLFTNSFALLTDLKTKPQPVTTVSPEIPTFAPVSSPTTTVIPTKAVKPIKK